MEQAQSQQSTVATHGDDHHGPTFIEYMIIFGALCLATATSYALFEIFGRSFYGVVTITMVSIVKATLVAVYFMHLKFDWNRLYFIVIPLMILTVMTIVVLMPDVMFGWWAQNDWYHVEVSN
ncbi:MAG: cytochrome C oxidase subunit IV family protein [Gemmataceae bacterium]